MIQEVRKLSHAYRAAQNGRGPFLMQGPNDCNRMETGTCPYCIVPDAKDRQIWTSFEGAKKIIDYADAQKFGIWNYKGGESCEESKPKGPIIKRTYAPCLFGRTVAISETVVGQDTGRFRTEKEDITFFDYTLGLTGHASKKGMVTYITTNGDPFKRIGFYQDRHGSLLPHSLNNIISLRKAGLDVMALSLHSFTDSGLKSMVQLGRVVAKAGIVPVVTVVATKERVEKIPFYAKICANNGLFFSVNPVQTIGGRFSSGPGKVNLPIKEEVRIMIDELMPLKEAGFIFNTWDHLTNMAELVEKPWRCDLNKTSFVHAWTNGERGELGVCQEFSTDLDCSVDLESEEFKKAKIAAAADCEGCAYGCYYQQNKGIEFRREFASFRNMVLVRMGHWNWVRGIGQRAVSETEGLMAIPKSELEIELEKYQRYRRFRWAKDAALGAAMMGVGAVILAGLTILLPIELGGAIYKVIKREKNLPVESVPEECSFISSNGIPYVEEPKSTFPGPGMK